MEFTRLGALLAPIGALALASTAITAVGAPAAQASAPTVAYAVIGTIATPYAPYLVAIDTNDDTLYVGSFASSKLMTVDPGTTSGTVSSTLALPWKPAEIAVDSDDDTVFVRPDGRKYVWVTAAGRTLDDTLYINTSFNLQAIAVDSRDDTLYVSIPSSQGDDSLVSVDARNTDDSRQAALMGISNEGLAVDQANGTVWAAAYNSSTVSYASSAALQFTSVGGGPYLAPFPIAVGSFTHAAVFGEQVGGQPGVTKVGTNGTPERWTNPSAVGYVRALSLNTSGTRAVFRSGSSDDSLWILDTLTMEPEVSPLSIGRIQNTAQAISGLIYIAPRSGNFVRTMAKVQGSLSRSSAAPGDTLTVTITPAPATAAGRPVVVDDSTLPSVSFGGITATAVPSGANTFSVTVPSAASGTVEAVATLAGGATLSLGNVTIGSDVPPPPAIPAAAPTDVVATPGDAAASVSWSAPVSSGTYPVSHYLATSSPGGRTCLVVASARTCEVTGLANGTAYTFMVKALTGAGWSADSSPSNVVVPRASAKPSIVITGAREGQLVVVTGSATGMGMGGMLKPWLRVVGQTSFTQGAATILVSMDGTFEWSRKTGKRVSVYVAIPDGSMRSNTITIAGR